MVRLSTFATSTFTSALKVRSTVLPDSMFFSFDRTTAPPLPGLWCWNQMTCQSWPSRLRTMPFLRSLVVAMRECLFVGDGGAGCGTGRRRRCPGGRPRSLVLRSDPASIVTGSSGSGERPDDPDGDAELVLAGPDRQRLE